MSGTPAPTSGLTPRRPIRTATTPARARRSSSRRSTTPTSWYSTSIPISTRARRRRGPSPSSTKGLRDRQERGLLAAHAARGDGTAAVVKTSGKTGLHVFVPIERTVTFDTARHLSEMVGRHVVKDHPKEITIEWAVEKRTGKIFIDYNMNVRGKTLAAAYSPRGMPGAPVSMPLTWDELEGGRPDGFHGASVPAALEKTGDRWHDGLRAKQNLARIFRCSTREKHPQSGAHAPEAFMAARSIGSVTISFGLVAIPVKLYTATQSANAISFNLLHKGCGSRLQQQYVCLKHGTDRRARRHGEGLRIRQGPVCDLQARRDQGAGGSRHARHRYHGVRSDRVGRSGLLRQDLLPRA